MCMDAKTQVSIVKQNRMNLEVEPTIGQIWDVVKQLRDEIQELRNDFKCTVSRTLEENQELKWASHYSQSSGDNLSLEDFLVELDE
jgi:hypothetical protein